MNLKSGQIQWNLVFTINGCTFCSGHKHEDHIMEKQYRVWWIWMENVIKFTDLKEGDHLNEWPKSKQLRPVYTKPQWLIWSINKHLHHIWSVWSDSLGLPRNPGSFTKKSKQLNQSEIASDIAALMLMLNVNGPLAMFKTVLRAALIGWLSNTARIYGDVLWIFFSHYLKWLTRWSLCRRISTACRRYRTRYWVLFHIGPTNTLVKIV